MSTSEQQQLANIDRPVSAIGSCVQIVLLAIGGAVVYGVIQDQVTAHVCVEYFTIGHYDYWGLQDPTLLAFEWGVIATWWVGLFLGIAVMISAQAGRSRPRLTAQDLLRPMLMLLASTGFIALAAGVTGYVLAQHSAVYLTGSLATSVPEARHFAFLADLWAHSAAYLAGSVGGIAVCIWSWHKRGKLQGIHSDKSRTNGERSASRLWERTALFAFMIIGGVGLALGLLFLLAVNAQWIM
jgi:hypothetical protein